jgi:integrase
LAAALQRPGHPRHPEHPLRSRTIHLALLLLYCCGLRRGELLKLRLGDIDSAAFTRCTVLLPLPVSQPSMKFY